MLLFSVNLDHVITNVSRSFLDMLNMTDVWYFNETFLAHGRHCFFYNAGILSRLQCSCSCNKIVQWFQMIGL